MPDSMVLEQRIWIAQSLTVLPKPPDNVSDHITHQTNPQVRVRRAIERLPGVGVERVSNTDEQGAEDDNLEEWDAN